MRSENGKTSLRDRGIPNQADNAKSATFGKLVIMDRVPAFQTLGSASCEWAGGVPGACRSQHTISLCTMVAPSGG